MNVEYVNKPPTVKDVPRLEMRLIAKSLVSAYEKHISQKEEQGKWIRKRTTWTGWKTT